MINNAGCYSYYFDADAVPIYRVIMRTLKEVINRSIFYVSTATNGLKLNSINLIEWRIKC